jgi:hypothetical protein
LQAADGFAFMRNTNAAMRPARIFAAYDVPMRWFDMITVMESRKFDSKPYGSV